MVSLAKIDLPKVWEYRSVRTFPLSALCNCNVGIYAHAREMYDSDEASEKAKKASLKERVINLKLGGIFIFLLSNVIYFYFRTMRELHVTTVLAVIIGAVLLYLHNKAMEALAGYLNEYRLLRRIWRHHVGKASYTYIDSARLL